MDFFISGPARRQRYDDNGFMLTPGLLLRLEGLLVLAAAIAAYRWGLHGGWLLFFVLLLAPDLSLLAYAAGGVGKWQATLYNAVHSYLLPGLILLFALMTRQRGIAAELALIWIAHIGMDRMVGYGLKYAGMFKPTHLQAVERFPNSTV